MNQSNKALRDEVLKVLSSATAVVVKEDGEYIGEKPLEDYITELVALVTNHIKEALIAAAVPSDTTPAGEPEYVPLTAVHQLLEEVSNGK